MKKRIARLIKRVSGYLEFVKEIPFETTNVAGWPETNIVLVFALTKDMMSWPIFSGFGKRLGEFETPCKEITSFSNQYKGMFPRHGYQVLFVFRNGDEMCVADVSVNRGKLKYTYTSLFRDGRTWHGDRKGRDSHLVVVMLRPRNRRRSAVS